MACQGLDAINFNFRSQVRIFQFARCDIDFLIRNFYVISTSCCDWYLACGVAIFCPVSYLRLQLFRHGFMLYPRSVWQPDKATEGTQMATSDYSVKSPVLGYNGKTAESAHGPAKGVLMSNGQIKYDPFPYNSINDRVLRFGGFAQVTLPPGLKFTPYQLEVRKDIDIHVLFCTQEQDEQGPDLALLRYAPGAFVEMHEHMGYEMVMVLSGDYIENGVPHLAGSLIVRAPGTFHSVASKDGCELLISRYVKVKQRPDLFNEFKSGNEDVHPVSG